MKLQWVTVSYIIGTFGYSGPEPSSKTVQSGHDIPERLIGI